MKSVKSDVKEAAEANGATDEEWTLSAEMIFDHRDDKTAGTFNVETVP